MNRFFKKQYKRIIILGADLLCLVLALVCRPLSAQMLSNETTCWYSTWGGQCLTCGATHFVNDLLSFRIGQAFLDHQLLFVLTVFFLITLVMLNLWLLFDLAFAKKMLKWMYHIPTLVLFVLGVIVFMIRRNLGAFDDLLLVFQRIGDVLVEKFPR